MKKFKQYIEENAQIINYPYGVLISEHLDVKFEETFEIRKQHRIYSEEKCLQYIYCNGRKIYESQFRFMVSHQVNFLALLSYAIDNGGAIERTGFSKTKGLMLMGPVGSGKTAYFKLIRPYFFGKKQFVMYNCSQLAAEFSSRGYAVMETMFKPDAKIICLTGVGEERIAMNYGSTCDVVYEIVQRLYDMRTEEKQPILHLTTRLDVQALEDRYGTHFRNMLRVMVNKVVID